MPSIGDTLSTTQTETDVKPAKRSADSQLSEEETFSPKKVARLEDKEIEEEEQDMFENSDVEILSQDTNNVEVVTLGDSMSESTTTFSLESSHDKSSLDEAKNTSCSKESSESLKVGGQQPPSSRDSSNDESNVCAGEKSGLIQESPHGLSLSKGIEAEISPNEKSAEIIEESPKVIVEKKFKTSTPGQVQSETQAYNETIEETTAKDEDTMKLCTPPDEETTNKDDAFKTPNEDFGYTVVVMKTSEYNKLSSTDVQVDTHFAIKQEMQLKVLKKMLISSSGLKRLSDISSLSGGSSGYQGDVSSSTGSSLLTSSDGSKRDRLSIMPEMNIPSHKTLSPLPKRLLTSVKENKGVDDSTVPTLFPSPLEAGTPVFAKWVERTNVKFWPGVIQKEVEDSKYSVLYEDGLIKVLKVEDIIPADGLQPGNQVNVEREDEEGIFNVAVLVAYPDCSREKENIFYQLEFEAVSNLPQVETKYVSYKMVHLTLEQVKKIKQDLGEATIKNADVSLDNLLTGKRRTRTPSKRTTPAASKGSTPRSSRGKRGGANVETSVAEEEELEAVPSKAKKQLAFKRGSKKSLPASTTSEDEDVKKTTKPRNKIFKGLTFLLTQGKNIPVEDKADADDEPSGRNAMDSETEADDRADQLEVLVLNKTLLQTIIQTHGGHVLDSFPGEKEKIPSHVIVISDRYCRTMTFLLAVAYGFERINFHWIHNCVAAKKLLPRQNYYLQVGFSSVDNREVEHHEACNLRDLFNDFHFLVSTYKTNCLIVF
jgi:hypothetical protein